MALPKRLPLAAASGKLHIVLRHVDPSRPRGPLYRAFARFTASRLGFWLSRQIGWRIDPVLLRLTGGRLGTGGADEAERDHLWALADNVFPPFDSYRRSAAKASRTIPILQLKDGAI